MVHVTFSECEAVSGGAVYVSGAGSISMYAANFRGCEARQVRRRPARYPHRWTSSQALATRKGGWGGPEMYTRWVLLRRGNTSPSQGRRTAPLAPRAASRPRSAAPPASSAHLEDFVRRRAPPQAWSGRLVPRGPTMPTTALTPVLLARRAPPALHAQSQAPPATVSARFATSAAMQVCRRAVHSLSPSVEQWEG